MEEGRKEGRKDKVRDGGSKEEGSDEGHLLCYLLVQGNEHGS